MNAPTPTSPPTPTTITKKRPKSNTIPTTLQTTITPTPSSTTTEKPIEILLQLYSDRIFLVLTRSRGKIGTLLRCTSEHSIIDNSTTYEVTTLLGGRREEDVVSEVYARRIMERIVRLGGGGNGGGCVPLLLGISLDDGKGGNGGEREVFEMVVGKVVDLYGAAIRSVEIS